MNKTIIAVLVIVVVAAGAFFYFRSTGKEEENRSLSLEAFEKLTPVAARVPQAGLPQMAAALSQYHAKNGTYPKRLIDLYPDFIPWEGFIRDLDWSYVPRGDNFNLSKSIAKRNKRVVASIDKGMIPRLDTGMLIAAVAKSSPQPEKTPIADSTLSVLPLPLESSYEKKKQEPQILIDRPEVVSVEPGAIRPGISEDIGKQFLVWRDENGVLGFGNVKYPAQNSVSIYDEDSWVEVKYPQPRSVKKTASADNGGQPADLSGAFLVWKDENGRLGYGNVMYPDGDRVAIRGENDWVDTKTNAGAVASKAMAAAPSAASKQTVAEQYSNEYVVWKDSKGNIGFGNVQYPAAADVAFICVEGSWQRVVK